MILNDTEQSKRNILRYIVFFQELVVKLIAWQLFLLANEDRPTLSADKANTVSVKASSGDTVSLCDHHSGPS